MASLARVVGGASRGEGVQDEEARQIQSRGVLCVVVGGDCLLYTSPSPRDATLSRMPSSA